MEKKTFVYKASAAARETTQMRRVWLFVMLILVCCWAEEEVIMQKALLRMAEAYLVEFFAERCPAVEKCAEVQQSFSEEEKRTVVELIAALMSVG